MIIDILTLFPEMYDGVLNSSIIKRAIENELIVINIHNYRNYSESKHKKVDDYSYGGGAGMLIGVGPVVGCLEDIPNFLSATKIITTPQGSKYNQAKALELSKKNHLIIICGHYEGIDHRISEFVDEEISIGDFILTGGEIASLAILDSVVRLIPGVLGNAESSEDESFVEGLLEYPQYTRPEEFRGLKVPDVLMSGNHENIRKWRRFKSLERTFLVRPDLLNNILLTKEDEIFLELIKEGKSI